MPEASIGLNSSKRKFYKLLDNLSSSTVQLASENHAASTTAVPEHPSKRFRLLGREPNTSATSASSRPHTAGPKTRPRSSIFPVGNAAKSRPKSAASAVGEDITTASHKQANFAPWSHEQFLSRLKTFADVRLWTPKPPVIGEVEWAKRGWSAVGKETVGCKGGCEKRVVVRVAAEEDQKGRGENGERDEDHWWLGDIERELAERYRNLVIEGHAEECLWRRKACDNDIYRIKMADPVVWQSELRERYVSLLDIEATLPTEFNVTSFSGGPQSLNIEDICLAIPDSVLHRGAPTTMSKTAEGARSAGEENPGSTQEPATDINKTALTMALLGWYGKSQNNVKLAYCAKCFQRAGLWLFTPKPDAPDEARMLFDPVEQHREHCPWKNPDTQRALGRLEGMSGWQVLVNLINGYKRHDKTPRKAAARPVSAEGGIDLEQESPVKSREEQASEDRERKSRLQRIKRAFTVKKSAPKKVAASVDRTT